MKGGCAWPEPGPGAETLEAGPSQLLQDDLDLAVQLSHVQQEGHVVAVMLDDVVVHVDQDSAREKRDPRLQCVAGPCILTPE